MARMALSQCATKEATRHETTKHAVSLTFVAGLRLSNEGNTAMRTSAEAYLRGSTDVSYATFLPWLHQHGGYCAERPVCCGQF